MKRNIAVPFFYQYHGIKFWRNGLVDFGTNCRISSGARQSIYKPYIDELLTRIKALTGAWYGLEGEMYLEPFTPHRHVLKKILWILRGTKNILRNEGGPMRGSNISMVCAAVW